MLLIVSYLFLASCIYSSDRTSEPTVEKKPIEWIRYQGKIGPGKGKRIVLISGDEEYRSEEALPQLARILAVHHGFDCTVLFAQDPKAKGVINPNFRENIPGMDALARADLMIIFTRFRALPDEQMKRIQDFLMDGKPVIGIRTATHAFEFKDAANSWRPWSNSFQDVKSPWNGGFGRLVLGENWYTHHGWHKHQSTRGMIAPGAESHPIMKGISQAEIWGATDVYGVRLPFAGNAQSLVLGQVINRVGTYNEKDLYFGMRSDDKEVATVNPASKGYNPNEPMMPIAWIQNYLLPEGKQGSSFTSTIGSSSDLLNEGVRRMFVNATYHLLDLPVPDKALVELLGDYRPSQFSFQSDEYWKKKNLLVSDYLIKE